MPAKNACSNNSNHQILLIILLMIEHACGLIYTVSFKSKCDAGNLPQSCSLTALSWTPLVRHSPWTIALPWTMTINSEETSSLRKKKSIPDDDLTKLMIVFLSGSNILANLRAEAEVGNALVLTVDATEAGNLLRRTQLWQWKQSNFIRVYTCNGWIIILFTTTFPASLIVWCSLNAWERKRERAWDQDLSWTYCSCKESEQLLKSTWNFTDALDLESIGNVRVPQRFWRVDTTTQGHHTGDLGSWWPTPTFSKL